MASLTFDMDQAESRKQDALAREAEARQRYNELIDARQSAMLRSQVQAENMLEQEQYEDDLNPVNEAATGAAAGSAFGPWGTVIGGAAGLATGIFKGPKAIAAKAKEEGWSGKKKRRKMLNHFFNPVEHIQNLGSLFDKKNAKGTTAMAGAIGKGVQRSQAAKGRQMKLDQPELGSSLSNSYKQPSFSGGPGELQLDPNLQEDMLRYLSSKG